MSRGIQQLYLRVIACFPKEKICGTYRRINKSNANTTQKPSKQSIFFTFQEVLLQLFCFFR